MFGISSHPVSKKRERHTQQRRVVDLNCLLLCCCCYSQSCSKLGPKRDYRRYCKHSALSWLPEADKSGFICKRQVERGPRATAFPRRVFPTRNSDSSTPHCRTALVVLLVSYSTLAPRNFPHALRQQPPLSLFNKMP